MSVSDDLRAFLERRPQLLPGRPAGELTLHVPRRGSSGDVWVAEVGGVPFAAVRRCEIRRAARRLLWAHDLAQAVESGSGRRPLPALLGADLSRWRTRRLGGPVLTEEWIEGRTLDEWPEQERLAHAEAVARALAALHSVRRPRWERFEMRPRAEFGSRLAKMIDSRIAGLSAGADTVGLPQEEIASVGEWLHAARESAPAHREYSLVHNHVAADDMIVRPGGDVALIDIGSLQLGPPEPDLAAALDALGRAGEDPEPLLAPYSQATASPDIEGIAARLPMFRALHEVSRIRSHLRKVRPPHQDDVIRYHLRRLARILGRQFPLPEPAGGP